MIGCGKEQQAKIFRLDGQNQWQQTEVLPNCGLVRDIKWAPSLGRSYQLIATGSSDGFIKIYQLKQDSNKKFVIKLLESFDVGCQVWSLGWNLMGTVLSCCSDDGVTRLFKATSLQEWKQVALISADNKEA